MLDLNKIYNLLLKNYGYQGWWPINSRYHIKDYSIPKNKQQEFEIIIGSILTQSTNWKNTEKAIKNLRSNKLLSPEKINSINIKKLALIIKSSGYHNEKAKKLKEFTKFYSKNNELTRDKLLGIYGIGKETADSILLYACKKPYFVIDAYTKRIMNRLGFKEKTYDEFQSLFMKNLDNDHKLFNEFHALIVKHGKETCKKNPLCNKCCLNKICEYGKSNLS